MVDQISALHSPTAPIVHDSVRDDLPDTAELSFNELWQDKEKGLSFGDLLDIVNPLHHIPVVSTIYRMVTGDEIGMRARLAGGALFGGPIGFAAAGIVAGVEEASGASVEEHVASLFGFDEKPSVDTTPLPPQLASLSAVRVAPAAGSPAATATGPVQASSPIAAFPASSAVAPASQPASAVPRQASNDAANAGLAERIAQAQRAQAGLLAASLNASLNADGVTEALSDEGGEAAAGTADSSFVREPMPFRSHPYMLPHNAPSNLVIQTMERALQRYHQSVQRQAEPPPTPSP